MSEWGTEGAAPDMSLATCVSANDVRSATAELKGVVMRTPVLHAPVIDSALGARAWIKPECLQRTGAFKARGAYNAVSRLSPDQKLAGVLTYSSGNHAQAIALASALLGVRAVIVMPSNAPRVKLDAVSRLLGDAPPGSRVVEYDPEVQTREALGRELAEKERLTLIPPYDHPHVIAGQGTAALELFEDVATLDRLYVPCGGGGLLSGCAVIANAMCPTCEVVGVEPELADDANRSVRDRRLHIVRNPPTIADGARTPFLGRLTFPLVLEHVDRMMSVSEREIAGAMKLALGALKVLVEPAGALGLAGALRDAQESGARVGVILSGGNVDLDALPGLLALADEPSP